MPRTCSPTERTTIQGQAVNHYLYLQIANPDGVLTDVTSLGGLSLDMLDGASWGETIDQVVSTGTLVLRRDTNDDTLAPLMGASSINRTGVGAYAPFLEKGRAFVLSVATVAPGVTPSAGDKKPMLTGRIDAVHEQSDPVTVDVSDLGAWVTDAWIRDPKTYASTTTTPGAGLLLDAVIQAMLNDTTNAPIQGGPVTLYVPTTPAWQPVGPAPQDVGSLMAACRDLAQEIGWELRYRYDASDVFRLTLYEPDRANNTPDWTIGPSEYTDVTNLETNIQNIRNVIRVKYVDASGVSQSVTVTDAGSVTKYGPRFMQVASSTIRTSTDATTLANAILSDLSEADADQEITMPFFWPVQLGDLVTFQANGVHYDTDQTLAVVGYSHSFRNGEGVTTIQTRGKVAGAYKRWLRRGATVPIPDASDPSRSILRIADTESNDGTSATMAVTIGALVDHVQIFSRTSAIDAAGDPYDFSDLSVPATVLVKKPDAGTNGFSLSLPQPSRGYKLAGRMVPYYLSPAGEYLAGDSVPFTITAAPPALNAIIHATRTGAEAALSIDVAFGVSDGPVRLDVIETVLGVDTTILSTTLSSPATLDPSGYPALDGRPIPFGAESVSWRAVVTDVSGQPWTFGPVTALPPLVSAAIQTSESGSTGTVSATVTDAGGYLDPAGVDELDPSKVAALTWHVTRLGVTTAFLSTTAPGAGTSGVYTFDVALDPKHPILVHGYRHYVDGSTDSLGSWTFDTDKIADVASLAAANDDANAVITANFDTDVAIGANCARYSLDGGTTWTTIAVTSDLVAQATIARTASKQTAIVQGVNALDGAWGNTATVEIDAYISEGPSLTAKYLSIDSTSGQIVWACTQGIVTLSIDGAAPTTPPASPIPITLDTDTHSYDFVAVSGDQTENRDVQVEALPPSGGGIGAFSSITNVLGDASIDAIDFGWLFSGPSTAKINIWVSDPLRYGDSAYHLFDQVTTPAARTYRYTAGGNITTNHGDPTVDIGFFAEAAVDSWTIGANAPVVTTYNHA